RDQGNVRLHGGSSGRERDRPGAGLRDQEADEDRDGARDPHRRREHRKHDRIRSRGPEEIATPNSSTHEEHQPMSGSIDPTRAQFDAFKSLPRDTPIHMLNLIRLRERAEYPQDHPNHARTMSGLEAYREYGRTTAALFGALGGQIVWSGRPEVVVTGPAE